MLEPIENEPSVDEVTSAILGLFGALAFVEGEEFSSFPDMVKVALEKFDKPELRTSLSRRLYHPELYVKKGQP